MMEKYTIMPIYDYKKVIGNYVIWDVKEVGYAACQCTVKETHITHNEDGSNESKYKVEVPFSGIYMKLPISDGVSTFTTSKVFDSKEEAIEERIKLNKKLAYVYKKDPLIKEKIEEKIQSIEQSLYEENNNLVYERV